MPQAQWLYYEIMLIFVVRAPGKSGQEIERLISKQE